MLGKEEQDEKEEAHFNSGYFFTATGCSPLPPQTLTQPGNSTENSVQFPKLLRSDSQHHSLVHGDFMALQGHRSIN